MPEGFEDCDEIRFIVSADGECERRKGRKYGVSRKYVRSMIVGRDIQGEGRQTRVCIPDHVEPTIVVIIRTVQAQPAAVHGVDRGWGFDNDRQRQISGDMEDFIDERVSAAEESGREELDMAPEPRCTTRDHPPPRADVGQQHGCKIDIGNHVVGEGKTGIPAEDEDVAENLGRKASDCG